MAILEYCDTIQVTMRNNTSKPITSMENKMNNIDSADETEYNRVQSVLAQREKQKAITTNAFANISAGAGGSSLNWQENISNHIPKFTGIAALNLQTSLTVIPPLVWLVVGVTIVGGALLYYHDRGANFVSNSATKLAIESVAGQEELSPIEIAAGISVQYHYNGFPIETLIINPLQEVQCWFDSGECEHSSTGPAQLTDDEYLPGEDPNDIDVAATGMAQRIKKIKAVCETGKYDGKCSEVDIEIAIAMAQNGPGFTPGNFQEALDIPSLQNGNVDWAKYFETRTQDNPYTKFLTFIRGRGRDYSTQYMLDLYTTELRKLHDAGYELPEGIDECDLNYMEDLSNGKTPTPCD